MIRAVPTFSVYGLVGIPEVNAGDDVADLIIKAAEGSSVQIEDEDVVVVTQKIISKAEGRIVDVAPDDEDAKRVIVEKEAVRILRRRHGLIIAETSHGFVCANAGVDASNLEKGKLALLPLDPDKSARRIRSRLQNKTGANVAIIISDTFGRAWRVGQTDVAIGVAGMLPLLNYRDTVDRFGNVLLVTNIAIADEIAGAAEMVMAKADGIPVAIVKGIRFPQGRGNARQLVRDPQDDLFR